MDNHEANSLSAWLVKQPTQDGTGHNIGTALKRTHPLVNDPTLDIWRQRVVLPMIPLIAGPSESIEYLDIRVEEAGDRLSLSGDIVAITHTRIVQGTFETFDNSNNPPIATAKSRPRAAVHTVRLDGLEVPDFDDDDEPWNAGGTLTLVGDHLHLELPARPGREHAIVDLAASFSR